MSLFVGQLNWIAALIALFAYPHTYANAQEFSPEQKKALIEILNYEIETPFLTDEFNGRSEDFQKFVKENNTKIASATKDGKLIKPNGSNDFVILGDNTDKFLMLFLSPTCAYCADALDIALKRNNFKEQSIAVFMTPKMEFGDLTSSLYVGCDLKSLTELVSRMRFASKIFNETEQKSDDIKKLRSLRRGIELSIDKLKECRSIANAKKLVSNIELLFSQCGALRCGRGYVLTNLKGYVEEGSASGVPAWFFTTRVGSTDEFSYDVSGVGTRDLEKALAQ